MANTSYGGSKVPSSTISQDRQRQRLRRRMEQEVAETDEDLPSFSEPRRLSRQDSLASSIHDVLGDPAPITQALQRHPTSWFGTTRHQSGANAAAGSNPSSSQRSSGGNDKLKSRDAGSSAHKHASSSGGQLTQQQQQQQHEQQHEQQHGTASRTKPQSSLSHQRMEERHSSGKSGTNQRANNHLKDSSFSAGGGSPLQAASLPPPASRERLQSEDMPRAVEQIFREMNDFNEEPLSDIQTPKTGREFCFAPSDEIRENEYTVSDEAHSNSRRETQHSAAPTATAAATAEVLSDDSDSSGSDASESDDSDDGDAEPGADSWSKWLIGPNEEDKGHSSPAPSRKGGKSDSLAASDKSTGGQTGQASAPSKHSSRGRGSSKAPSMSHGPQSVPNSDEPRHSLSSKHIKGRVPEKRESQNHSKSNHHHRGRHSSASRSPSVTGNPQASSAAVRSTSGASHQSTKRPKDGSSRSSSRETPSGRLKGQTTTSSVSNSNPKSGSTSFDKTRSDQKSSKLANQHRKAGGKSEPDHAESLPPRSVNNNSNNNEVSPNVMNVTVSHTQQLSTHQRIGNKRPRSRIEPSPAADSSDSSDSDSPDEDDDKTAAEAILRDSSSSSSESSDSDAEDDLPTRSHTPSPVRPPFQHAPPTVNVFRERTGSSSSSTSKVAKLEVSSNYPSSPAKKQASGYGKSVSSASRRSAPSPIARKDMSPSSHARPTHKASRDTKLQNATTTDSSRRDHNSSSTSSKHEKTARLSDYSRRASPASKPSKASPRFDCFPSLWVRLRPDEPIPGRTERLDDRTSHEAAKVHSQRASASPELSKPERTGRLTTMSTGSETEQPIRRAKDVQVQAASSSDLSPHNSNHHKRKFASNTSSAYPANHPQQAQLSISNHGNSLAPPNQKSKRRKRENLSPAAELEPTTQRSVTPEAGKQSRDENSHWKDRRKTSPSSQYPPNREKSTNSSSQTSNPANSRPTNELCQSTSSSASAGVAAIVSEPDSSWPEQQRLLRSDDYMKEGKRLKHEGDACVDARTGRTRPGEALSRALIYFEAALCFVMNGYMLEIENVNDRQDNSGSPHSPSSMYHQTISLLDYIMKMRPHDDQQETAFKRLNLSCLRCQALLYLRVYKLKKDIASGYFDNISEFYKSANKASRTPSPWHPCATSGGQNAVSPVSPAVPSPYGSAIAGPSPIGGPGSYESVSSSTQVNNNSHGLQGNGGGGGGKITSPPTPSSSFPPKMYDIFKHYHTITGSLMQAHEKWEQAEAAQAEHADFFRNVDTLCARSLMLHSSLRDMATYNKVVLHQLRAVYLKSPRE